MLVKANSQQLQQNKKSTENDQSIHDLSLPSSGQQGLSSARELLAYKNAYQNIRESGQKALLTLRGAGNSIYVALVKPSERPESNSALSEKPNQQQIDRLSEEYPNKALFALHPVSKVHFTSPGSEKTAKAGVSLNGRYAIDSLVAVA